MHPLRIIINLLLVLLNNHSIIPLLLPLILIHKYHTLQQDILHQIPLDLLLFLSHQLLVIVELLLVLGLDLKLSSRVVSQGNCFILTTMRAMC